MEAIMKELKELQSTLTDKVAQKADVTEIKTIKELIDGNYQKMETALAKEKAERENLEAKLAEKLAAQGQKQAKSWVAELHEAIKAKAADFDKQVTAKTEDVVIKMSGWREKAAGVMSMTASYTGEEFATQQQSIVAVPFTPLHLTQLIITIPSAVDVFRFPRHVETIGDGGFGTHNPDNNSAKSLRDYDIENIDISLQTLAGILKVTRNMLRNVPALTAYLNLYLPEDYFNAEDAQGYAALAGTAGLTTGSTAGGYDGIFATMGILEDKKYNVNGIVMRPSSVYELIARKDDENAYDVPGGVVVDNGGQLRVLGTPVIKATWAAADTAILGDWRMFNKVQSEGLTVRSTEFNNDDFEKNRITFRAEATIGWAVMRPAAFSFIDLGFVS